MNSRPGPLEGLVALLAGVAALGVAFAIQANGLSGYGAANADPITVERIAPTRDS